MNAKTLKNKGIRIAGIILIAMLAMLCAGLPVKAADTSAIIKNNSTSTAGGGNITVTVQHYDESGAQIYSDDVKEIGPSGTYPYQKATNWTVSKIEVIENNNTKELDSSKWSEIDLQASATVKVTYKPTEGNYSIGTTFYDYTLWGYNSSKKANISINNPAYYTKYKDNTTELNKYGLGIGSNTSGCFPGGYNSNWIYKLANSSNGSHEPVTTGNGNVNNWKANGSSDTIVTGILNRIDNVGQSNEKIVFNYDDPGLFTEGTDEASQTDGAKQIFKDYQLNFTRSGDTYTLASVNNTGGHNSTTTSTTTESGARNTKFFPLDGDNRVTITDAATNVTKNNCYFGMRYDVKFSLGDYTGPLNYSFTGDDDLWVLLDGKMVLDLGGIHGISATQVNGNPTTVDLWKYIKVGSNGEYDANASYDHNQSHIVTILYMERGAGDSDCTMIYTIPNAEGQAVTNNPTGSITLNKVNSNNKGLKDATFDLTMDSNTSVVYKGYKTDDNGHVTFSNLQRGQTYTLTETAAPSGYLTLTDKWQVVVGSETDSSGKAITPSVTLQKSSDDGASWTNVDNNTLTDITQDEYDIEHKGKLVINKTKTDGSALSGAVFTLYDSAKQQVGDTQTSGADGTATFTKLEKGTYILEETTVPDGYAPATENWVVKVTEDPTDSTKLTAALYKADGTTPVTDNKITNYTKQEYVDKNLVAGKTTKLINWDKRTYQIDINAHSVGTSTVGSLSKKPIDVMLVFDLSGSMNGKLDGGTTPNKEQVKFGSNYQYKDIKDSLDTNAIYYYGDEGLVSVKYTSSGYDTYVPQPMKYIDGQWMYYDGEWVNSGTRRKPNYVWQENGWTKVPDGSEEPVYTWNSRISALKEASSSFVSGLAENNSENQIGVAGFTSTYSSGTFTGQLIQISSIAKVTNSPTTLLQKINQQYARQGTFPEKGLTEAETELLPYQEDGNSKYVILFSDGAPSSEGATTQAQNKAKKLRDAGYTVISILLGSETEDVPGSDFDSGEWLKTQIASLKPDGTYYYFNAKTAEDLKNVFSGIQSEISSNGTEFKNAQITDTIDARFTLASGEAERLKTKYGTDITITENKDSSGKVTTTTITWKNQTIPYQKTGSTDQWNETINVVAKSDYIGGNDVSTNVADQSYISTELGKVGLGSPKVNVKTDFVVNDAEDTIFWGDNSNVDANVIKKLFDAGAVKRISGDKCYNYADSDGTNNSLSENRFTYEWYSDESLNTRIADGMDGLKSTQPDTDQTYYLKVIYNPGSATDASNANSTIGQTTYKTGGDTQQVVGVNGVDHSKTYGVYAVHVVKGQIVITKHIDKQYSSIDKVNSNQTFVFKIKNNTTGDVFYETLNFNANQSKKDASAAISNLKKGNYTVTEETSWSPKYSFIEAKGGSLDEANAQGINVTFNIGNKKSDGSFIGLEDLGNKRDAYGNILMTGNSKSIDIGDGTKQHNYQDIKTMKTDGNMVVVTGTHVTADFTNNIQTNWNWLSDTAAAVNKFTKTTSTSGTIE